jgi:tetratricopeptide (TPR) repeat protein
MSDARRRRRAAALALAIAGAAWTPLRATTPAELFERGNGAYEQGRFEDAAAAYETILGYGIRDPRVHYNLANAHARLGRLGPAILHYERALRLDPADAEARDNLEYVRGRIRDRVPSSEMPYPVSLVTASLGRLSPDRAAWTFLALYVLAAGLLGAIPLAGGAVARRVLGYAALIAGLLAAGAGGGMAYVVRETTAPRAIVMADRADVLSGPADDNTVLFTVHEGTRLEVRNARDGWLQVGLPNALSGWIRAAAVERV